MTRAKPTRAEELRRHRETFLYAREHGLTLREAELEMARESARHARERLATIQRCGRAPVSAETPVSATAPQRSAPADARWMMRD